MGSNVRSTESYDHGIQTHAEAHRSKGTASQRRGFDQILLGPQRGAPRSLVTRHELFAALLSDHVRARPSLLTSYRKI